MQKKSQYMSFSSFSGIVISKASQTQHIYPFDRFHFVVLDNFCHFPKIIVQVSWKKIHFYRTQRHIEFIFYGSSEILKREIFEGSIFISRIQHHFVAYKISYRLVYNS